jgi:hypothetical protein
MTNVTVTKRVNRLEKLMAQLIMTVDRVDQHVDQLSSEMREFKTEMRLSHERADREMREFKAEMQVSRERSDQEMREFRQELGRLDRKMSTMTEDIVAPSIPNILHQIVGCPRDGLEFLAVRFKKRHPVSKNMQEFDVVAACGDYLLITETKRRLSADHVKDFLTRTLPHAKEFFPEYSGKKIIGAMATLSRDESVLRFGESQGIYLLGVSGLVMEVLNAPGFVPKTF